MFKVIEIGAVR